MSEIIRKPRKAETRNVYEKYMSYIELSKYLFAPGKNQVYDMNEIPSSNKFYKPAKELAKQLDIDWKKMTHEDSNRIMLALLEDTYCDMKDAIKTKKAVIEVNVKIFK